MLSLGCKIAEVICDKLNYSKFQILIIWNQLYTYNDEKSWILYLCNITMFQVRYPCWSDDATPGL